MKPEGGDRRVDSSHATDGAEPKVELPVEPRPGTLVERARELPAAPAPQRGRLRDGESSGSRDVSDIPVAGPDASKRLRVLIDVESSAVDEHELGVALELGHQARDRTWKEEAVGAQEAEEIAARMLEAEVERTRLPVVRLRRPPREPVGVAPDELDAPVGRPVVDDDGLHAGVVLLEHRAEGLLEVPGLLVRGGHDADERPRHRRRARSVRTTGRGRKLFAASASQRGVAG